MEFPQRLRLGVCFSLLLHGMASANPGSMFRPEPWLKDLAQVRQAFSTLYPDLEWEAFDHDVDLQGLYEETRRRVAQAHDAGEARAAFDAFARHFGDRHVRFRWPHPTLASSRPPEKPDRCAGLGYDATMRAAPLATLLPGFMPVTAPSYHEFPAGTLPVAERRVGIVELGLFSEKGFPALCEAALAELHLADKRPCNAECAARVDTWAAARLTTDFAATLHALAATGADALLVDVTGNGGGSEWSEAAARMLTPVRLAAIPTLFVKGEHWRRHFAAQERALRSAAQTAGGADALRLTEWADAVAARGREAAEACDAESVWYGRRPSCLRLGDAFFSTGLLPAADPETLRSKSWGPLVFTPLQYPYREGEFRGPLVIAVDGGTGSAAENFAAELQDNRAAIVLGAPTVGAGCGHTDGGTPTTLRHSGAILELPDCVRQRRGGLNLVSGVQPDVLVGLRSDDAPRRRAALLAEKLEQAVAASVALQASPGQSTRQ